MPHESHTEPPAGYPKEGDRITVDGVPGVWVVTSVDASEDDTGLVTYSTKVSRADLLPPQEIVE